MARYFKYKSPAEVTADAARATTRQLLVADHTASGLEKMLVDCRTAHRDAFGDTDDFIVGLQLTHSGRYSVKKPLLATHDPILDSFITDKSTGKKVDASYPLLTDDDLNRTADHFVAAAKLVAKIG